ncbi:MAG: hypothetical protein MJZ84_06730 [Paludibacteraceae bacterium]|nr:hypothetical protein [Paludibacteraceae bacterium]
MDFERAAIQTLYYDYPIETAVQYLHNPQDDYLNVFNDITRWRCSSFTMSEWKLLELILRDNWLKVETDAEYPHIANVLQLLPIIADKVLTLDQNREPQVLFDDLFRWRSMTSYIGEDAMVAAYLAKRDVEDNSLQNRNLFLWSDILHHNNRRLNEILYQGLSDIHSHYNASVDVFHLNWTSLMNGQEPNFDTNYFAISKDLNFIQQNTLRLFSRKQMCVAAAYLRELLYRIVILKEFGIRGELQEVKGIFYNPEVVKDYQDKIRGDISELQEHSLSIGMYQYLDYALPITANTTENKDNINIIYQGERALFYNFFSLWQRLDSSVLEIAPYMYLYILIKSHIRREIVETNSLKGFENFANYQIGKNSFYSRLIYNEIAPKVIVQSSIGETTNKDTLETRIIPNKFEETIKKNFDTGIFSSNVVIRNISDRLSFVIHFLKQNDNPNVLNSVRYSKVRKDVQKSLGEIIEFFEKQNKSTEHRYPKIVGIDVAGSELKCRPEIYAHAFRYAKKKGLFGRTYHVGEDFYDLVDGLRAIDEAVRFLDLDSNSRLGHALALSTNAKHYYQERFYKMIITKQALLDNCVWLYYRAAEWDVDMPQSLTIFLMETATTMYNEIGYGGKFDLIDYWQSMILRGDAPCQEKYAGIWQLTRLCKGDVYENARHNTKATDLLNEYLYNPHIKENGRMPYTKKYPANIIEIVEQIQQEMIRFIAEKGIAIECCPSSNLKIGRFSRYDEHPIFKFRPIDKDTHMPLLNVSINTDDRGVFATSLYNEYSLIALAMMKMKDENGHRKYNDETVYDYIERIRLNGQQQRFK